ncbi:MAG TPA: AAA family ATPase [Candidatus Acidoferrales bacterium]|nr:AAA family ATPase [Candidatus Acidoferrales bacterium]
MSGNLDKREVRCASCGWANDDGAKFCTECSAPLVLRCPACGLSNRASAKFCAECAAPLREPATTAQPVLEPLPSQTIESNAPAGSRTVQEERRHLTVLFCDLVGSTEIASNLDPEDWREILASYHSGATEAVERFGGHVAQYLGDGLLVYFGYPEAHDDDPHRAVLAGLAIIDSISTLNSGAAGKRRPKLSVRIGIHSGSVVVGESSGNKANVYGDVPNVASRVQTAAAPDTVLISAAVHHLVSGLFVVEDHGAQPLKGIQHPIQLYRVVQASGARGRLAAAALRGLTPFVGREDEMRLLLNRWERIGDGEGQLVVVVGEAGIGKSRLVQQFREHLADAPHTWVDCAAASLHQSTPFYAVEDMLQQAFRWQGEQSAEERIAGLEASLQLAAVNLTEAVPLIAGLMNLPIPPEYPPLQMQPDQLRKRLLATIAAWAIGSARVQPLVIAIEDLHWADPSTLDVLQLLAEQCATAPLLVICTARPEFRAPWPMRAHHAVLSLNRLSKRDSREIAEGLISRSRLLADTIEAVVERCGGVPLFVEELIQTLVESGKAKLEMHEIPATLRDLLMARLDRLGDAREVAQLASVIGAEFSWPLLRAIAAVGDEQLTSALKKLADAQLLLEEGVPPDARYKFRHALIQDAAYQSLLKSRRHYYHQRIAQVLEEQFPEEAQAEPQVLAYHYTEAEMLPEAIAHWQAAGQQAMQRSANVEAVSHFSRALELLETQPESPERFQQELALQLALGTPLIATQGFASPQVGKVYARARELCQQAGDAPQLFPVLWGMWVFYTAKAEHGVARELAAQCLRLAESTKDPVMLVEAHHALGVTLTGLADLSAGMEHLDYVIVHHDTTQNGSLAFGQDPKVVCLSQAAWTVWLLGYPEQALKRNDEAIALAQQLGHPYSLAAALNFGSMVVQLRHDVQMTAELAEAGGKLSSEHEFPYWMIWSSVMRGWVMTQRGQVADGIAQMREGVAAFRATGAEVMVPYFLGLLAEAHANAGQQTEGLSVVEEAQTVVNRSRECWWEPELCRLKGELMLNRAGGHEPSSEVQKAAAEYFHQALDMAARLNEKSLELRAAMSLSRLWSEQGKKADARRILIETYSWFKEGLETADLTKAKRQIEAL